MNGKWRFANRQLLVNGICIVLSGSLGRRPLKWGPTPFRVNETRGETPSGERGVWGESPIRGAHQAL